VSDNAGDAEPDSGDNVGQTAGWGSGLAASHRNRPQRDAGTEQWLYTPGPRSGRTYESFRDHKFKMLNGGDVA
jgi:hypothetical protein